MSARTYRASCGQYHRPRRFQRTHGFRRDPRNAGGRRAHRHLAADPHDHACRRGSTRADKPKRVGGHLFGDHENLILQPWASSKIKAFTEAVDSGNSPVNSMQKCLPLGIPRIANIP